MFEPKSNLFIYWSNGIPPVSYISRNNCQIHSNELHFYLWLIVGSPPFHDLINKHLMYMYIQLINRCFIQVKFIRFNITSLCDSILSFILSYKEKNTSSPRYGNEWLLWKQIWLLCSDWFYHISTWSDRQRFWCVFPSA